MKLCALFLTMMVIGCAPSGFETSAVDIKSFLVSGDPMVIVEGAHFNKERDLEHGQLQGLKLRGLMAFKERHHKSLKSDRLAPNFIFNDRPYQGEYQLVTRQTNQGKKWVIGSAANKGPIELVVRQIGRHYRLTGALINAHPSILPIEVLHLSWKEDEQAMSILFKTQLPQDGQSLIALYFSYEQGGQPRVKTNFFSDVYQYFMDDQTPKKWSEQKESLTLSVCTQEPLIINQTTEAWQQWQEPLLGRFDLKLKVRHSYPPFSDLNTHCLYYIDRFIHYLSGEDQAIAATATLFSHQKSGSIFDADIFVWKDEIRRTQEGFSFFGLSVAQLYRFVILHELGHFLGLAHQWDSPSVMGYRGLQSLTPYDEMAIQNLYR